MRNNRRSPEYSILNPSVCSQKKNPGFSFSFLLRLIICCCPQHGWTETQTRQPRGLGRQQKEDGVKSQGIYFSQAPQGKKKKNHSMHHLATDVQRVMINEARDRIKKHIFTYFSVVCVIEISLAPRSLLCFCFHLFIYSSSW